MKKRELSPIFWVKIPGNDPSKFCSFFQSVKNAYSVLPNKRASKG